MVMRRSLAGEPAPEGVRRYTRGMWDPDVMTVPDITAAALELFVGSQRDAIDRSGTFDVVVSGGSTPVPLFRALATRSDLPWARTRVYWADERFVPPEDERSNAGAARKAFLDQVGIPPGNIVAWPILATPADSAAAYAATLRSTLGSTPTFDLTLLGMGDDGHTASLFPGTGAVNAKGLTVSLKPPSQPNPRLSLTSEALSRSRVVAFLIEGEKKRKALLAALGEQGGIDEHPARAIGAIERLLVITDLDLAVD